VGLNDEQNPVTSTAVQSEIIEIMEETQTEQTKMSEEPDRERYNKPSALQKVFILINQYISVVKNVFLYEKVKDKVI
jgi:hypothetical protein